MNAPRARYCSRCGRDADQFLDFPVHVMEHDLRDKLDHTGPHGICSGDLHGPACACPDPVLTAVGWRCDCCHGLVPNALPT